MPVSAPSDQRQWNKKSAKPLPVVDKKIEREQLSDSEFSVTGVVSIQGILLAHAKLLNSFLVGTSLLVVTYRAYWWCYQCR